MNMLRPPNQMPPLLHGNRANNGEAGFLGAAAVFNMGQFIQRAR